MDYYGSVVYMQKALQYVCVFRTQRRLEETNMVIMIGWKARDSYMVHLIMGKVLIKMKVMLV